MSQPFDLMVAPNGARLTKADHPALPITPDDVLETARACEAAGATAIHVHVRDGAGHHSLDAVRYNDLHAAIARETDLHVQVSTEAGDVFGVAAQLACLSEITARDASVALREIERAPELVAQTYATAADRGISVQHIVYAPTDLDLLWAHMDAGIVSEPEPRVIFVLGRYSAGQRSSPEDLKPFLRAMGDCKLKWSICAFGPREHECLLAALKEGGQVRLGFENNRLDENGNPYPDNAASVAAFVNRAERHGFTPRKDRP